MSGIIMDPSRTHEFLICKSDDWHAGKGRALLRFERSDGAKRFQVIKITAPDGDFVYAARVGHGGPMEQINLDYDLRVLLGVETGQRVNLEIRKAGILGTAVWYISVRDPIARISAILAVWSIVLGGLGLILSVISLLQG